MRQVRGLWVNTLIVGGGVANVEYSLDDAKAVITGASG